MDGNRGAQAPNTVGGRPGWGPDLRKDWSKKINEKERKKAIHSALRATREIDVVKHRGHVFKEELSLPVVIENDAEKLATTKEVIELMNKIGIYEDIKRSKESIHLRAGVGKMRNRPYRERKSILIVASKIENLLKGAGNLAGVDIATPEHLNAELLAPGGDAGRLTVFTEGAIETMRKW
jgi:large subunit ribosomal protein L4e